MAGNLAQLRAASRSLSARPAPAAPQTFGENFGAGVTSSIDQTQAMGFGLLSMAGDLMGNKALQDFGQRGVERNQAEAAKWAPRVQSIKDIDNLDDFFDWTAGTVGNVLPSIAVTAGTGGVGALVGKKLIATKLRKEMEKRAVGALAAEGVAETTGRAAIKRVLSDPANQKQIMSWVKRGAIGGGFVGSTGINTGDLYNELKEAGVRDAPMWAAGGGTLMGALDVITAGLMLDDLVGANLKKQLTENLGKALAKGALKYGAIEGLTESAQEGVALATRALADPSFDPTSEESVQRLIDSMAAGALVGALGGAMGVGAKRAFTPKPAEDEVPDGTPPPPAAATPDAAEAAVAADMDEAAPIVRGYGEGTDRAMPDEKANRVAQLFESVDSQESMPSRFLGAFGAAAPTVEEIGAKTYKGNSDSLDRKIEQLQLANPEFEYEAKHVGDDRWVIAEYSKDEAGAIGGKFDATSQTMAPPGEVVQTALDDAKRKAKSFPFRTTAEKAKRDEYTAEFELFSEDEQGTRAVQPKPVRLALKTITRLGMRLDEDKSGTFLDRVRRAYALGMAELMATPTVQRGAYGTERMYARPTADLNPNAVVFEGKAGADSIVVRLKDLSESSVDAESLSQVAHLNALDRENLGEDLLISAPGDARGSSVETGQDVWAKGGRGDISEGHLRSVERAGTTAGADGRSELSSRGDNAFLVDRASDDPTNWGRPEDLQTYDPAEGTAEAEAEQAANAGAAAQFPASVSNRQLGAQRPGSTRTTKPKYTGFAQTLSNILTEFSKKFNVPRIGLMNIQPMQLAKLRSKETSLDEKRDILDALLNFDFLYKRYGAERAATLIESAQNAFESGIEGFVLYLGDREVVFVNPSLSQAAQIRVLSHELGHSITERNFNALTPELKQRLRDAYDKSSERNGGRSAEPEFFEWMADQFVAWQARRADARAPVERWFGFESFIEATSTKLKELWAWLAKKIGLDQTFAQFMDGVALSNGWDRVGLRWTVNNDFAYELRALGAAADPFWPGLPLRRNFTPPKQAGAWAKGKIKPWLMQFDTAYKTADGFRKLAKKVWDTFFASQDGIVHRMRTADGKTIPSLQKFWKNFSLRAGEAGGMTHPQIVKDTQQRWARDIMGAAKAAITRASTFNGKLDAEKAARLEKKLVSEMRKWDGKKDPQYDPEIESFALVLRKSFDDVYALTVATGLPLRKVLNYFPRVADQKKLADGKDRAIAIIEEWGRPTGQFQGTDALGVYDSLMSAGHVVEFDDMFVDGVKASATYASAMQHRQLPPGLVEALSEFYIDDLTTITTTYAHQMARRAEFQKFGGGDMEKHKEAFKQWINDAEDIMRTWIVQDNDLGRLAGRLNDTKDIFNAGSESSAALMAALKVQIGDPPRWDPAGRLKEMIAEIEAEGITPEDREQLAHIINLNFGRVGHDMPLALRRAMGQVMLYQNARLLLFTAISALPDLTTPMIRGNGVRASLRSYVKAMKDTERKELVNKMMQTWGLAVEHFTDHILADGVGGDPQLNKVYEWSDHFFRWTGVKKFEGFARSLSISVGIDYLLDAAEKGDTAKLSELNLTAEMVKQWDRAGRNVAFADGAMTASETEQRIQGALVRFMHEAKVSGINTAQKTKWGADPRFMLLWHLKSFMYEFQHRVMGRIGHQLNSSNVTSEQLRFVYPAVLGMALAGFGLELRELLQYSLFGRGDEARTDQMSGTEYLFTLLERSGFLGMAQFLTDVVDAGMNGRAPVLTFLGPTAGQLNDAVQRLSVRTIAQAIPGVNSLTGARDALTEWIRD